MIIDKRFTLDNEMKLLHCGKLYKYDEVFLSSLCDCKHEYSNTGCSLRFKSTGMCVDCYAEKRIEELNEDMKKLIAMRRNIFNKSRIFNPMLITLDEVPVEYKEEIDEIKKYNPDIANFRFPLLDSKGCEVMYIRMLDLINKKNNMLSTKIIGAIPMDMIAVCLGHTHSYFTRIMKIMSYMNVVFKISIPMLGKGLIINPYFISFAKGNAEGMFKDSNDRLIKLEVDNVNRFTIKKDWSRRIQDGLRRNGGDYSEGILGDYKRKRLL